MKRALDFCLSLVLLFFLFPLFLLIGLIIKLTSYGPAIFKSDRVGKGSRLFTMFKFRTMQTDTPQLATHLIDSPCRYLTPVGGFLRKTSLDELPQLINVLKGDMSLVGPRPALFNQHDLISLRAACGVDSLLPGITGWAQVNGRDDLPVPKKVECDEYYLWNRSFLLDLKILWLTIIKAFCGNGVSH
jgi:O-antigen biosynthesis protein WbqP